MYLYIGWGWGWAFYSFRPFSAQDFWKCILILEPYFNVQIFYRFSLIQVSRSSIHVWNRGKSQPYIYIFRKANEPDFVYITWTTNYVKFYWYVDSQSQIFQKGSHREWPESNFITNNLNDNLITSRIILPLKKSLQNKKKLAIGQFMTFDWDC